MTEHIQLTDRGLGVDTLIRKLAKFKPDTMCRGTFRVVGSYLRQCGLLTVAEIKTELRRHRGRRMASVDLEVGLDVVDIKPSVYSGWSLLVDQGGRTFPIKSKQTEFLARARSTIGEAT